MAINPAYQGRIWFRMAICTLGATIASTPPIVRAANYSADVLYSLLLPDGSSSNGVALDSASNGIATGWDESSNDIFFWSSSIGSYVNVSSYSSVWVNAISTRKLVGSGQTGAEGPTVALMWNAPSSLPVNLNPPGFSQSWMMSADSSQEVGQGEYNDGTNSVNVGLLWTGDSPDAILLGPPVGFQSSQANDVSGNAEVGSGSKYADGFSNQHALLWHGSTASVIDLDPGGFRDTWAFGTDGTQQVGRGEILGGSDALLWYGTAASVVDLSPAGYTDTQAGATNGSEQVGEGSDIADSGNEHALLWAGSASSVVDLHMLLPLDGTWDISEADSVDSAGNVFGWAAGTYNGVTGIFLVEWSPVPEPVLIGPLAMGWMFFRRIRSRSMIAR